MPVSYDSKKLIPAPFISISRDSLQRDDGKRLGATYTITVRGKMTAWKGSPNSSGAFWDQSDYPPDETVGIDSRLTAILKKQQALRDLFATDGKSFEVSGYDGFAPLKCNPRVRRVEFPDGEGRGANWTEYCEFVITLEADYILGLTGNDMPTDLVTRFSEDWDLEVLDEAKQTYRLTRALSATGRRLLDETGALKDSKEAWENARDYLVNTVKLGLKPARMASAGVLDSSLSAYNYTRADHVTESAGVCSINESWVCFDPQGKPPAVHERTITSRTSAQDGRVTVSIDGSIQGLEQRDNTTRAMIKARFDNALDLWKNHVQTALVTTAQSALDAIASGFTINALPAQATIGQNDVAGTVTYQYEFDNRPSSFVPGALSEVISVRNSYPADVFAEIPIPGRPIGPVIQGMATITSRRRTINIEVQMPAASTTLSLAAPDTSGIILALMPAGAWVEENEDNWIPTDGRYSRTVSFKFQ